MIWGALIGAAVSLYGANKAKKSNQASIDAMSNIASRPQYTALGSAFNPGGTSRLAPSIQQGRAGLIGQMPGYKSALQGGYDVFSQNVGESRNQLIGNESQFMQSALNPIRQAGASQFGALTKDLGRRGITGSSFANNQIGNFQAQQGRTLSDATAQIQQQQIAQRLGIDESLLNASTGLINNFGQLDQQTQAIYAQQAAEQLNLLGLSQQQTAAMMQPLGLQMQNNQQFYDTLGRTAMGAGGMLAQSGNSWNPFASGYQANSGNSAMPGSAGAALSNPWG